MNWLAYVHPILALAAFGLGCFLYLHGRAAVANPGEERKRAHVRLGILFAILVVGAYT